MILPLSQMISKNSVDQHEYFFQFLVRHTGYQVIHQLVVGKFLEIVPHGVPIRFVIHSESDQALVIVHKFMTVSFHLFPFTNTRFFWSLS